MINDRRKKSNSMEEKPKEPDVREVDPTALTHIRMVTGMIEGRFVTLAEILSMLASVLRQHSMDFWKKPIYGCPYRGKQPP